MIEELAESANLVMDNDNVPFGRRIKKFRGLLGEVVDFKPMARFVLEDHYERASPSEWEDFYAIREEKNTSQHALIEEKEEYRGNKYLIRGRYILSNVKSGILIIDTYRAQQRILYDNMMTSFVSAPLASQKLMFPLEMELNQNEIDAWNESKSLLKQFGFQFELENNGIRLESLPSCISEQTSHSCIDDVSRTLTNTEQPDKGELAHEIVSNLVHVV